MRLQGKTNLFDNLERFQNEIAKESLKQGKVVANKLIEESAKRAPLDEGNLEKAFEKEVSLRNNKLEGVVFISQNGPAGQYAMVMHEAEYKLGEISKRKQASNPNVRVGRKYMERGFNVNIGPLWKYFGTKLKQKINFLRMKKK